MTRCPECGAVLDSMSELARHECEPTRPTPEEVKRIRVNMHKREDAEYQAHRIGKLIEEYDRR